MIFLEQKLLYVGATGPVPEELYAIPLGKADIKREGTDVTVVATSAMVPRALSAATVLERDGISVEVVDPRTLQPLDEDTILAPASAPRTRRCPTTTASSSRSSPLRNGSWRRCGHCYSKPGSLASESLHGVPVINRKTNL